MKFAGDRLRLSASDVANFVACQHMTRLDLLQARGALRRVREFDVGFEDLVKRGEAHELTVLERFRADGRSIAEISPGPTLTPRRRGPRGRRSASAPTSSTRACCWEKARTAGRRCWGGPTSWCAPTCSKPRTGSRARASGTTRSWTPSWPGPPRRARSRRPRSTPTSSRRCRASGPAGCTWRSARGDLVPLKVGDYAAYERQARRALGSFIAADPGHNPPADPYPEPVEHCVICRWDDLCKDRRRRDDDLSLVAGITKGQRRALKAAGVPTRRGLAALDVLPGGNGASQQSLAGARLQARLQVASEDEGRIRYEILEPERDVAGAPDQPGTPRATGTR